MSRNYLDLEEEVGALVEHNVRTSDGEEPSDARKSRLTMIFVALGLVCVGLVGLKQRGISKMGAVEQKFMGFMGDDEVVLRAWYGRVGREWSPGEDADSHDMTDEVREAMRDGTIPELAERIFAADDEERVKDKVFLVEVCANSELKTLKIEEPIMGHFRGPFRAQYVEGLDPGALAETSVGTDIAGALRRRQCRNAEQEVLASSIGSTLDASTQTKEYGTYGTYGGYGTLDPSHPAAGSPAYQAALQAAVEHALASLHASGAIDAGRHNVSVELQGAIATALAAAFKAAMNGSATANISGANASANASAHVGILQQAIANASAYAAANFANGSIVSNSSASPALVAHAFEMAMLSALAQKAGGGNGTLGDALKASITNSSNASASQIEIIFLAALGVAQSSSSNSTAAETQAVLQDMLVAGFAGAMNKTNSSAAQIATILQEALAAASGQPGTPLGTLIQIDPASGNATGLNATGNTSGNATSGNATGNTSGNATGNTSGNTTGNSSSNATNATNVSTRRK